MAWRRGRQEDGSQGKKSENYLSVIASSDGSISEGGRSGREGKGRECNGGENLVVIADDIEIRGGLWCTTFRRKLDSQIVSPKALHFFRKRLKQIFVPLFLLLLPSLSLSLFLLRLSAWKNTLVALSVFAFKHCTVVPLVCRRSVHRDKCR